MINKLLLIFLSIFITSCYTQAKKSDIDPPPNIKSIYYFDQQNKCLYLSIESDINPVINNLTGNYCGFNESELKVEYRNIRLRVLNQNDNCEYVLAYFENGATARLNEEGQTNCPNFKPKHKYSNIIK